MKKNLSALAGIFICFYLFNSSAFAQEKPSSKFSIGYGLGIKKNLRKDNTLEDSDKDILLKNIPLIQGSLGRFSLGPQGLSMLLVGNRFANLSAYINRGGDRYKGLGMTSRKESFFAGLSTTFMKYGLKVAKDLNARSKAFIIHTHYSDMLFLQEDFMLKIGLGIEWFDDQYAQYYFGVRSHEATATRLEYHPHNYFQPGVSFFPIYKISEKISTMLGLTFKYVPHEIRKSPTMNGDRIEFGSLLGVSYSL